MRKLLTEEEAYAKARQLGIPEREVQELIAAERERWREEKIRRIRELLKQYT